MSLQYYVADIFERLRREQDFFPVGCDSIILTGDQQKEILILLPGPPMVEELNNTEDISEPPRAPSREPEMTTRKELNYEDE